MITMIKERKMNKQIANQKCQNPKCKKKLKFKELSRFWKGLVIGLTIAMFAAISAAIGYFMVNIYPLLNLMGV